MSATFRACILAFALALFGAITSYVAGGATFGLLIGSVAFASLIAPPLATTVVQRSRRAYVAIMITLANLIVWVFAIPIADALTCSIVLLTWSFALVAVRIPTVAILVAAVWLYFPILIRSEVGAWLVAYHPLFAMNGACKTLGVWVEQPILYQLTSLGQDVFYELPTSIWRCVLAHAIIGLLLLLPSKPASDELSDRQTTPTPPPAPQELRTP